MALKWLYNDFRQIKKTVFIYFVTHEVRSYNIILIIMFLTSANRSVESRLSFGLLRARKSCFRTHGGVDRTVTSEVT